MTNEWTKEIERLTYERDQWEAKWRALRDQYATTRMALDSTRDNDAVVSAAVAESRARTFRAAITYVTGDLRTPHPDADAEAKAFAAAVRERVSAAVAEERKRWATDAKSRVVFLHANGAMGLNDVLSALDAAIGGDL